MNSKKDPHKLAKQLSSVRQKKLERLKNRIAAGKYQVDNKELALALFMAR